MWKLPHTVRLGSTNYQNKTVMDRSACYSLILYNLTKNTYSQQTQLVRISTSNETTSRWPTKGLWLKTLNISSICLLYELASWFWEKNKKTTKSLKPALDHYFTDPAQQTSNIMFFLKTTSLLDRIQVCSISLCRSKEFSKLMLDFLLDRCMVDVLVSILMLDFLLDRGILDFLVSIESISKTDARFLSVRVKEFWERRTLCLLLSQFALVNWWKKICHVTLKIKRNMPCNKRTGHFLKKSAICAYFNFKGYLKYKGNFAYN